MRKLFLTTLGVLAINFLTMAQDIGQNVTQQLQECNCNEILMISGALEKKYTASWLENITYENGMIVFSKGEQRHQWNAEKIVFVESPGSWVRVHLEAAR